MRCGRLLLVGKRIPAIRTLTSAITRRSFSGLSAGAGFGSAINLSVKAFLDGLHFLLELFLCQACPCGRFAFAP
jgi:hypothetical protein